MLFDRIPFIAGKTVDGFEMNDIRTLGRVEGGESLSEQRSHRSPAFFGDVITGDQSGKCRSVKQGIITAPDPDGSVQEATLLHEPCAALVGAFKYEGCFIKQIKRCENVATGLFLREPLHDE